MSRQLANESFGQNGSGQALSDDEWITSEQYKEFAQHIGGSSVSSHSLHLSLKFARADWQSPLICHQLRFAKIIFNSLLNLMLRHNRIERRLRPRIVLWPNPMTPIDLFDRVLVRNPLGKR